MNSSSLPLPAANSGAPIAIPRQQVSIERLPTRRQGNEPRESMNCKSCRKRKIKCNRMRPSCEACQVFQCPCIYDAVPKKRGPKTDVLEALLKRVDGLEAKLKEKNSEGDTSKVGESAPVEVEEEEDTDVAEPAPKRLATEASKSSDEDGLKTVTDHEPTASDNPASPVETDAYLHTYFARFHGKPYYILDEASVRHRIQSNQLPDSVAFAIWAVASRQVARIRDGDFEIFIADCWCRHTPHPGGTQAALQLSQDYAQRARRCIDTDDLSIDCLQASLLLVLAFMASGHSKKAYMLMSSAIAMAMALELHREIDAHAHVTPVELYRPFLPVDLAELAGNGQHQSWQIEATNMCFLHANAIGELIDAARHAVHIHGAHYSNPSAYGGDVNVFSASSNLLSREMKHLSDLNFAWANIRHQSDTLQEIYSAHGELVKAMVASSMRYTPGFHLEEFFERYSNIGGPGGKSYRFDPAHLSMSDIVIDFTADRCSESPVARETERYSHKRKNTLSTKKGNDEGTNAVYDQVAAMSQPTGAGNVPYSIHMTQLPSHVSNGHMQQQVSRPPDAHIKSSGTPFDAAQTIHGYTMPPDHPANTSGQGIVPMSGTRFSPAYGYAMGSNVMNSQNNVNDGNTNFDAMFGALPTNTFNSAAGWQGEDGQQHNKMNIPTSGVAPSPGTKSSSGSTGTGHSEEKDPFLSLLEQLAEDEQRFNGGGADLDFFLTGNNIGA
ncbi:hypothetical protein MHUMG1_02210 [Metarhizium humberi]|uniref:Zn(2)-C6 fungal-type domain-containing protein n=1 Tax=Metarhizium humberi TaxID=2596975 RepID=A0A9P8MFH8_9HYPO|nr:hypothetical protein MHUMG1_02210 [Metarhizium humberi]